MSILEELYAVLQERKAHPRPDSYTSRLLAQGQTQILKKIGEEAIEVLLAAQYQDEARLVEELADLTYHVLVLLVARGIPLEAVAQELRRRRR